MLNKYIEELKKIKILTLEEEKSLWPKIAAGDDEARSRMILSYQPLVFKTSMRFKLSHEQAFELIQEGMVGLIEALERFDYARGVAFSLFAMHRIRGRMLDHIKKTSHADVLYLDCPLSETDTIIDRLATTDAGPAEIAEENLMIDKVKQVLGCLPEKEQKVLQGIYLEDMPPEKMAKMIEVSQTHVYRLQKKGVKRIRGMLSKFMHDIKW